MLVFMMDDGTWFVSELDTDKWSNEIFLVLSLQWFYKPILEVLMKTLTLMKITVVKWVAAIRKQTFSHKKISFSELANLDYNFVHWMSPNFIPSITYFWSENWLEYFNVVISFLNTSQIKWNHKSFSAKRFPRKGIIPKSMDMWFKVP